MGNFDTASKLDAQLYALLGKKFGENAVFQSTIGRSVRMRELTVMNCTVFEHPNEQAKLRAQEFLSLVREMINRGTKGEGSIKPLPRIEEVVEHAEKESVNFDIAPHMLEVGNG